MQVTEFYPTFNGLLRAGRLQDAAAFAARHDMALDKNVLASLKQAREYWAGKENRDRGIGRPLTGAEQDRRLAALRAAQKSD